MSRLPARFSEVDVKRAVRGMISAGLPVAGLRVDASGFTVLTEAAAPCPPADDPMEARDAATVAAERLGLNNDGSYQNPLLPRKKR